MLQHEVESEFFEVVEASNPKFYFMEPKVSMKGVANLDTQEFKVDHTFGAADDNDKVYSEIAYPLIDMSLKGGMSTIFAYGQTGSGKTFTMQGI